MIRLAKKDFRRWLAKNQRVIVGDPDNPGLCPMCRYLKSRGAKRVFIDIGYRRVDGQMHEHCKWQRDFQKEAMRVQRLLKVVGLRGREALAILDDVTQ